MYFIIFFVILLKAPYLHRTSLLTTARLGYHPACGAGSDLMRGAGAGQSLEEVSRALGTGTRQSPARMAGQRAGLQMSRAGVQRGAWLQWSVAAGVQTAQGRSSGLQMQSCCSTGGDWDQDPREWLRILVK